MSLNSIYICACTRALNDKTAALQTKHGNPPGPWIVKNVLPRLRAVTCRWRGLVRESSWKVVAAKSITANHSRHRRVARVGEHRGWRHTAVRALINAGTCCNRSRRQSRCSTTFFPAPSETHRQNNKQNHEQHTKQGADNNG